MANNSSSCTKLDIYEGLLLAFNKWASFLWGTEGWGRQAVKRFQQRRWQLMTKLGKRGLAMMTSNDKPCVLVDSLVVLYNISYGQLGNLRWEGSAKHHQLTSGTSLVVRHRLSGHMPPNYGRASPGAALTGFGIPPSIITASRTQHYTSSYTNIYHVYVS